MDRCSADYGRMLLNCKIMKRYIITAAACMLSLPVISQNTDTQEIIRKINDTGAAIHSLECSFTQTKTLSILSGNMVSHGKMYFAQPGMLRWEYTEPYSSVFIMHSDTLWLKNENRVDTVDINRNRMYKELTDFMISSITGGYLADSRSFSISVKDEADECIVTLLPLKKRIKQMWSELILHFDNSTYTLLTLEMMEQTGDMTVIEFSDVVINGPQNTGVFRIN